VGSREQLRASDADRERVAARLREALDEGRLDLYELDDRLREVYTARTFGDLDRLVADLPAGGQLAQSGGAPAPAAPARPVPPSRHEANPRLHPALSLSWRLWFLVVAVNLVLWFLVSVTSGSLTYFWPIWVAGPWAAVNAGLTILFPPRHRP
jgi:hypothetical protein